MSRLSTRFGLPLLVLLLLAAIPILIQARHSRRVETCRDPAAFLSPLALDALSQPVEGSSWEEQLPVKVKGWLRSPDSRTAPLDFLMLRTWGLPAPLQNPNRAFQTRLEPDLVELEWLELGDTRLPVHVASQSSERGTHFALYTFFYDGEAIESPFWTRMRTALVGLAEGGRPITLVGVSGMTSRFYTAASMERGRDWIGRAWEHYRATCTPTLDP